MKKLSSALFVVFIMTVMLAVSCDLGSNSEEEQAETITINVNDLGGDIRSTANQKIVIENLEDGEFVEIVPVSGIKSKSVSRAAGKNLLWTDLNTVIPVKDEKGVIEFLGSDLGIANNAVGVFRTLRLFKGDNLTLSAYTDNPSFTTLDDKAVYYQRFMEYDISNLEEGEKSSIVLSDKGGGTTGRYTSMSSDYGILDADYWFDRSKSGLGVLDLSGEDHVYLYSGFSISALRGHTISEFRNEYKEDMPSHSVKATPTTSMTTGQKYALKNGEDRAVFLIGSSVLDSTKEYCLKVKCGFNTGRAIADDAEPRTVDGRYRGCIIPYKYEEDVNDEWYMYFYLGKIKKDFFFQYFVNNQIELVELPDGDEVETMENDMSEFVSAVIPVSARNYYGLCLISPAGTTRTVKFEFFSDSGCNEEIKEGDIMVNLKLADSRNPYSVGNRGVNLNSEVNYITVNERRSIYGMYIKNGTESQIYVKITKIDNPE